MKWPVLPIPVPRVMSVSRIAAAGALILKRLSTYGTGQFGERAAEIVARHPKAQRLFIMNAQASAFRFFWLERVSLPCMFTSSDPSGVRREVLFTDATEDFIHEMSRQQPWLRARYELFLGDLALTLTETELRQAPLTALTPARAHTWLNAISAEQQPIARQALEAFTAYLVEWEWLPTHPLRQREPV